MSNFSNKKSAVDTSDLSKILTSAIPTIETISQNNTDALHASSRISQTLENWNLPDQIATLNAYINETLGIQNDLLQSQSDNLNTNILSAFSISDEVYKTQSNILNSNLF